MSPAGPIGIQEEHSTSGSFRGVKGLYLRWTETGPIHPRGWRGGTEGGRGEGEEREKWLCLLSEWGERERARELGDGWGVVCAWANTPRCLLLSSHFSPKGKQRIERAAAVWVWERVCVCVCVCVCVGEVDLGGLYISSRESPPTNLPPGALGHWPPSLLPRDPQAAPRPPATSLVLTVMRTPRRGEEEETVYVSLPKEGDIRWLEKHDSAHPPLLSSPLLSLPPSSLILYHLLSSACASIF